MTFLTINNLKAALCSGLFLSPQAWGGAGLLEKAVLILLTPYSVDSHCMSWSHHPWLSFPYRWWRLLYPCHHSPLAISSMLAFEAVIFCSKSWIFQGPPLLASSSFPSAAALWGCFWRDTPVASLPFWEPEVKWGSVLSTLPEREKWGKGVFTKV